RMPRLVSARRSARAPSATQRNASWFGFCDHPRKRSQYQGSSTGIPRMKSALASWTAKETLPTMDTSQAVCRKRCCAGSATKRQLNGAIIEYARTSCRNQIGSWRSCKTNPASVPKHCAARKNPQKISKRDRAGVSGGPRRAASRLNIETSHTRSRISPGPTPATPRKRSWEDDASTSPMENSRFRIIGCLLALPMRHLLSIGPSATARGQGVSLDASGLRIEDARGPRRGRAIAAPRDQLGIEGDISVDDGVQAELLSDQGPCTGGHPRRCRPVTQHLEDSFGQSPRRTRRHSKAIPTIRDHIAAPRHARRHDWRLGKRCFEEHARDALAILGGECKYIGDPE